MIVSDVKQYIVGTLGNMHGSIGDSSRLDDDAGLGAASRPLRRGEFAVGE